MKAKGHRSIPPVRLLESDPGAYFEKLLQELNELEVWLGSRDDEVPSAPERRRPGAKR